MRKSVIALVAVCSLMATSSEAQTTTLSAGARVRIHAFDGSTLTGTLVRSDFDSVVLHVRSGNADFALPASGVRTIEMSTGRSAATGAKWGSLIMGGVGLTYVLVAVSGSDCTDCGGLALMLGTGITGIFAGTGALIGAIIRPEHWEKVSLGASISVLPNGVGLKVPIPGVH